MLTAALLGAAGGIRGKPSGRQRVQVGSIWRMRGYPPPVVSARTVGGSIISIDDIRLDKVLGEGANAFVFDGKDLVLKRRIAVKIWPPRLDHPGKDPTKKALAEARKLAQLKSDVIAPIYRAGRLDNGWIYARNGIRGGSSFHRRGCRRTCRFAWARDEDDVLATMFAED